MARVEWCELVVSRVSGDAASVLTTHKCAVCDIKL